MLIITIKNGRARFSNVVDDTTNGRFVTITRHGKTVDALVSLEAAEIDRNAMGTRRSGLFGYLKTFPGDTFDRNPASSRNIDF